MVSFCSLLISALTLAVSFAAVVPGTEIVADIKTLIKNVDKIRKSTNEIRFLDPLSLEKVAKDVKDLSAAIQDELPKVNDATLREDDISDIFKQYDIVCGLNQDCYNRHANPKVVHLDH